MGQQTKYEEPIQGTLTKKGSLNTIDLLFQVAYLQKIIMFEISKTAYLN